MTDPTLAAHRFKPMVKNAIGGRCQVCGGIGLDPQHAPDPTLAALRERPCDCGLVQVYGGVPWGVEHAPKCAALAGPSKAELRQALDAALAERDAAYEDAERLAVLVSKMTELDCAFEDDESPRRCFPHDSEWPSLDDGCEWIMEAARVLAAHRARIATEGSER